MLFFTYLAMSVNFREKLLIDEKVIKKIQGKTTFHETLY